MITALYFHTRSNEVLKKHRCSWIEVIWHLVFATFRGSLRNRTKKHFALTFLLTNGSESFMTEGPLLRMCTDGLPELRASAGFLSDSDPL